MLKIYNPLFGFTFLVLSTTFVFSSDKKKISLQWEAPENGTAVSVENETEYLETKPVLRSEQNQETNLNTEVNMTPTLQKVIIPGQTPADNSEEEKYLNNLGQRVAQKALEFFEKKIKVVNVNGVDLNIEIDCSFFVRAAYWEGSGHTIDLFKESIITQSINPNTATGVTLLAEYLRKNKRYQINKPQIGDIIIFDNTYDKNHNQKRDDYYTHAGIVTNIRSDNTIEFVHGNISRSVKKGYINFIHSDTSFFDNKPVNSYIRPRYTWEKDSRSSLASHLVRAFGGL